MVSSASTGTSVSEATVRYAVSAALPAGQCVVPIQTRDGVLMVVREGKITPEIVAEIVRMYDALTACGMINLQKE